METAKFTHIGGARVGNTWMRMNFSTPFVTLIVDDMGITLNIEFFIYRRMYVILKSNIDALEDFDGILSDGIRIKHHQTDAPQLLIFWTREKLEMKKELLGLGYPIG